MFSALWGYNAMDGKLDLLSDMDLWTRLAWKLSLNVQNAAKKKAQYSVWQASLFNVKTNVINYVYRWAS